MPKQKRYNAMLGIDEWVDVPDSSSNNTGHDWVLDALNDSEIDPAVEAVKPEIIFEIIERGAMQFVNRRVFTLGNFSAIIGKAKSKKTYLLSAIAASIVGCRVMWEKFKGGMNKDKNLVLYFDTEQGSWDAWNVANRIVRMAGVRDKFRAFSLRQFTPKERCSIIEFALMMNGDEAGLVVIDGVADLATGINDEEEATRVVSLLMRWSKEYNVHIATVIHQNKADNFATGHLGSMIMKKCEIIIAVSKDANDPYSSLVECAMSRSVDFKPFRLTIDADGMPIIDDREEVISNDIFSQQKNEDNVPF